MLEDLAAYKEKIENRDIKINELKEELKQLEKNIEANNRIFMRKNLKSSKPAKKNMFLFQSNRVGNISTNKKQDIIICKKNFKSSGRKKAKSNPKIGKNFSINKNNYFLINSEEKKINLNFYGTNRGKTLEYKNNKINFNNINNNVDINKKLFHEKSGENNNININNNMKPIRINKATFNKNEKKKNEYNKTEINYINNLYNNYIKNSNEKKKDIFLNKNQVNTSSQNNYNNKVNINKDNPTKIKVEQFVKGEKNKLKKKNVDIYKNIENYIESVFGQYFLYYQYNMNINCNNDNKK